MSGDHCRAVHVHAGAAIERHDVRTAFLREFRRPFRRHAHHRHIKRFVLRQIVGERGDDARRTRRLRCVNRHAELFQRRLRLDDDGIHPGFDERASLLRVSGVRVRVRQISVRFENRTERPQISQHKAVAPVECLARDARPGLVDGAQILGMAVTFEHQAAAAEGI